MSHSSSRRRRLALAGLTTLAALAAAPSAGATAYTVNARCDFGFLGTRAVAIGIDVPATAAPGASVVPFTITSASGPALQPILEEARAVVTLKTSVALPSGGATPSEATFIKSPVDASAINLVGESGQATVVYTGVSIEWRAGYDGAPDPSASVFPCSLPVGDLNFPKITVAPLPSSSYAYNLAGSVKIKTLIGGSLPLKGGLGIDVSPAGAVTGDLALPAATGRLNVMSFLPLTAKFAFVPVGRTTGTYVDGTLKTTTKARIKVTEVKIYGAIPIVTGNSCQTKSLSDITLTSGPGFSLAAGGALSGEFAVSDLNGCGLLNGLVNPRTSSSGNTITLQATPAATPVPAPAS